METGSKSEMSAVQPMSTQGLHSERGSM